MKNVKLALHQAATLEKCCLHIKYNSIDIKWCIYYSIKVTGDIFVFCAQTRLRFEYIHFTFSVLNACFLPHQTSGFWICVVVSTWLPPAKDQSNSVKPWWGGLYVTWPLWTCEHYEHVCHLTVMGRSVTAYIIEISHLLICEKKHYKADPGSIESVIKRLYMLFTQWHNTSCLVLSPCFFLATSSCSGKNRLKVKQGALSVVVCSPHVFTLELCRSGRHSFINRANIVNPSLPLLFTVLPCFAYVSLLWETWLNIQL